MGSVALSVVGIGRRWLFRGLLGGAVVLITCLFSAGAAWADDCATAPVAAQAGSTSSLTTAVATEETSDGTVYLTGTITSTSGYQLVVDGTVTIDLCGNDLTIEDPGTDPSSSAGLAAINVTAANSASLTIEDTSSTPGTLTADGSESVDGTGAGSGAGIGGDGDEDAGTVTIDSGVVDATGATPSASGGEWGGAGAGIGGGGGDYLSAGSAGGTITVNGGTVNAQGGDCDNAGGGGGAGIGGGGAGYSDNGGAGGSLTVGGGVVSPVGGDANGLGGAGAGVGGGGSGGSDVGDIGGAGGSISVTGGTLDMPTGGSGADFPGAGGGAAGLGGGAGGADYQDAGGAGASLTLDGGTITDPSAGTTDEGPVAVAIGPGGSGNAYGSVPANGSVAVTGGTSTLDGEIAGVFTLSVSATLTVPSSDTLELDDAATTNGSYSDGTIYLDGTLDGDGVLYNGGSIVLGSTGSIPGDGSAASSGELSITGYAYDLSFANPTEAGFWVFAPTVAAAQEALPVVTSGGNDEDWSSAGTFVGIGTPLSTLAATGATIPLTAGTVPACGSGTPPAGAIPVGDWGTLQAEFQAGATVYLMDTSTGWTESDVGQLAIPTGVDVILDMCGQDLSITDPGNAGNLGLAAINLPAGATAAQNASLTVEDTSAGTAGSLSVEGSDALSLGGGSGGGAGIGGNGGNAQDPGQSAGTLVLSGVTVDAPTGGVGQTGGGAGIGGGGGGAGEPGGDGGPVTVTASTITDPAGGSGATGGGAGIGGGGGAGASGPIDGTSGGNGDAGGAGITLDGGAIVTDPTGGSGQFGGGGAGIGGGGGELQGSGGTGALLTLAGGSLTGATGGAGGTEGGGGAGIGGGGGTGGEIDGDGGTGGTVAVQGGELGSATGGSHQGSGEGGGGAGIGGGGVGESRLARTAGAGATIDLSGGSFAGGIGGTGSGGAGDGADVGAGGADNTQTAEVSDGSVEAQSGTSSISGDVDLAGVFSVDQGATVQVPSAQTLELDDTSGDSINHGTIDVSGGLLVNGQLTNADDGLVDLPGQITGDGALVNDGSVTVAGTGWSADGVGPGFVSGTTEAAISGNAFDLKFKVPAGDSTPADLWVFSPTLSSSGELPLPAAPGETGYTSPVWVAGGSPLESGTELAPLAQAGVIPVTDSLTAIPSITSVPSTTAGSPTQTTTGTTTVSGITSKLVPPTIRERITSPRGSTHDGWWSGPVKITFTCHVAAGTRLAHPCPGPTVITRNGISRPRTITVRTTSGLSAKIRLPRIRIDATRPRVLIRGPHADITYLANAPTPRCAASDRISGIASCKLEVRRARTSYGYRELVSAHALSRAGLSATTSLTFMVDTIGIAGQLPSGDGGYALRLGNTYQIIVLARTRPVYVFAAPSPRSPAGGDIAFSRDGSSGTTPRWSFSVNVPKAIDDFPAWNIGIRIDGQLTILRLVTQT
jgi:hypothetical protein